jgi:hypothetical protein
MTLLLSLLLSLLLPTLAAAQLETPEALRHLLVGGSAGHGWLLLLSLLPSFALLLPLRCCCWQQPWPAAISSLLAWLGRVAALQVMQSLEHLLADLQPALQVAASTCLELREAVLLVLVLLLLVLVLGVVCC